MKVSDGIEALGRFFFDIVGTMKFGVVFILGIDIVLNGPTAIQGLMQVRFAGGGRPFRGQSSRSNGPFS
jgi:hypothetical protein